MLLFLLFFFSNIDVNDTVLLGFESQLYGGIYSKIASTTKHFNTKKHCIIFVVWCNEIMPKWRITRESGILTVNINGVEPSAWRSSAFICSCITQLNIVNFQGEAIHLYSTSCLDLIISTAIIPRNTLVRVAFYVRGTRHGFSTFKIANMVSAFQHSYVFWKKKQLIKYVADVMLWKHGKNLI